MTVRVAAYRRPGAKHTRFFSLTVPRRAFVFGQEMYGDLTDRASALGSMAVVLKVIVNDILLPKLGDMICIDVDEFETLDEPDRIGVCVLASPASGTHDLSAAIKKKAANLCQTAIDHLRDLQRAIATQQDLFWTGQFDENLFPNWPTEKRQIAMLELAKAAVHGDLSAERLDSARSPVEMLRLEPSVKRIGQIIVDGGVDGLRRSIAKAFVEGRVSGGDGPAMEIAAKHRHFECALQGSNQIRDLSLCMSNETACSFMIDVHLRDNRPSFTLTTQTYRYGSEIGVGECLACLPEQTFKKVL